MRVVVLTVVFLVAPLSLWQAQGADPAQIPTVQITPEQAAQPSTDANNDPRENRKKPLTPEEEMQRQIRLFDPMDHTVDNTDVNPAGDKPANNTDRGPQQRPGQQNAPTQSQRDTRIPARETSGDATGSSTNAPTLAADKPLPDSVAAMQESPVPTGPRVTDEAGGQTSEYTGPAVLSRAYSINTLALPSDMKFHESISFSSFYTSAIAKQNPDSMEATTGSSAGTNFTWSFSGQHAFKYDLVSFAYSGTMSDSFNNGTSDGLSHRLTLSYSHKITRRLMVQVVNNVALLSQSYATQNPIPTTGTSITNVNLGDSPTTTPYSSSSRQIASQVNVSWQASARLSYDFGGSYYQVTQGGQGLTGIYGLQATADVNYRYSRRTTIGLYYSHGHNQYPGALGASDTNSGGFSYALSLNRNTQLRARLGVARTETIAETEVMLSPLVAALLGTQVGILDLYTKRTTGDVSVQLVRDLRKNLSGSLGFVRGISPGNGLVLTSTQQVFSASLSMRVHRQYQIGLSLMSQTLNSVAQGASSSYKSDVAQISVSRPFRNGLALNVGTSYAYYGTTSPYPVPSNVVVTSGISWTPAASKLWPF